MARAIWSGSISFGLLNVPVKLYSAVARRNIAAARDPRVRQRPDQTPPRRRGDRRGGPLRKIVKAYEITPGHYVPMTKDEMARWRRRRRARSKSRTSSTSSEIDPMYFDSPYYLGPADGAEKAYSLLASGDGGLGQGRRSPASSSATRSTWRRSAPTTAS